MSIKESYKHLFIANQTEIYNIFGNAQEKCD
jgi:hypothetical protein